MNQNYKQIGVWVDLSKAHFIGYKKGKASLIETVNSPYERIKREEGEGSDHTRFGSQPFYSSNNESRKNNSEKNVMKSYFKLLEDRLTGFEEILLFGPGTTKEQLRKWLAKSKSFAVNRLDIQNCDKRTDSQLLAYVREFFRN